MKNDVVIRPANEDDKAFIFALSPYLAEVAKLDWHTAEDIQKMQDNYISEMLAKTSVPNATLIAEVKDTPLGFVHVRTHKDGISGETCGTVPLLAVSPKSQGLGLGKILMASAEKWTKNQGCRLLHLEVFANNAKANGFYEGIGFKPEMLHLVKSI
ncbi:GNAT family N-acetyltransferase [Paraglaciecola arctica]|uniref:GNAT family N-acetyltransferase n=1 Tax=Paraglaciecola arctica TaxID=1128911 RepID=UPI001C06B80A|nr:GNAT family N-acetyltransferase [Paraglaciecola arctica]MBU3006176.1 GNAT family N-acetyltransferase [Paraglaciecola arctica]